MKHCRGDLRDAEFVKASVRDCDSVIHTAAVAGVWGPWQHFYSINKLATDHVLAACRANRIPQCVFTSSPSVTFDGEHQRGVSETVPYASRWLCHYPHTKALAEQAVLDAHDPEQLATLALRPHLIWGEDDPHILPRILDRARSGRLRIVGDGSNVVDTVHVVNAAAAHLDAVDALAKTPEKSGGKAYFIAQDEPVNCWDWIRDICSLGRVPAAKADFIRRCLSNRGFWRLPTESREEKRAADDSFLLLPSSPAIIISAWHRQGKPRISVRLRMDEGLDRLGKAWKQRG